jgi:hypothetical protein
MHPLAVLLFSINLLAGISLIALRGWMFDTAAPALLLVAGGSWYLLMDWVRYRIWIRYESDFTPEPTQGWPLLLGIVGHVTAQVVATVWIAKVFVLPYLPATHS